MSTPRKPQVIYQPDCPTCNGLCCRSVTLPIRKPLIKRNIDLIRYLLMHKGVRVGIDIEDNWMMDLPLECKFLDSASRCSIYENRPDICREFPPKDGSCSHQAGRSPYGRIFSDYRQFDRYLKKVSPRICRPAS